jgi:hypothetical protein
MTSTVELYDKVIISRQPNFDERKTQDCAPTTARRTRISRFDDANERCKASNQPNLLSASFRSMRPSTTRSMFNGI